MSVSNLATILVRAIEARASGDAAARGGVYQLSRRTLERFLTESADLTDAERARQRLELDLVIEAIEEHYRVGRPGAPDPAEIVRRTLGGPTPIGPSEPPPAPRPWARLPPAPPPGTPTTLPSPPPPPVRSPAPPPARPTAAVPPPPPEAPRAPPAAPRAPLPAAPASRPPVAPPAPAAPRASPQPASRPAAPPPVAPPPTGREAPRGAPPPVAPAAAPPAPERPVDAPRTAPAAAAEHPSGRPGPAPAAEPEEEEEGADLFAEAADHEPAAREDVSGEPKGSGRRNLARAALLVAALVVLAVLRLTDFGSDLRRILSGEKAASEATLKNLESAGSDVPDGWNQVVSRLTAPTEEGVTGAFLWNDARGPIEKGAAGRVTWTPQSRGGTVSWIGRLVLTGEPLTAEILVEPDEDQGTSETPPMVMMMLRFTGLPEAVTGTPNFYRVDPRTGRHGEEDGSVVRIGIDGFLVGYRPRPSDAVADQTRRSLYLIDFALDADKRLRLFLSPPVATKTAAP